jgi:hypothetical protein
MTPELDQHIREKYPRIFSQRCEMSIGDGWFDIIDKLCANIQGHIDNVANQREWTIKWNNEVNDPDYDWERKSSFVKREERPLPELVEQVVATQIKEKFGTLRFYYSGGDDYIRGLEAMADSMSAVICEECGCPGESRSTKKMRWIRVLCDKHAEEQGYIEDEDSTSE